MLKKVINLIFVTTLSCASVVSAEVETLPILSGIGGDFSAIDADEQPFEFSDIRGHVSVIAFGYTNCADICPFTLGYLKRLYKDLSVDEQQEVDVIFVTIDPQYDTPGHLKSFIGHYHEDFIGLSGSQEQVDYIVSLYQAEYNKLSILNVPTRNIRRVNPKLFADEQEAKKDKASLYSHTVTLFLIDKEGYTRSLEYTGTPTEEFASKIRQLIDE